MLAFVKVSAWMFVHDLAWMNYFNLLILVVNILKYVASLSPSVVGKSVCLISQVLVGANLLCK